MFRKPITSLALVATLFGGILAATTGSANAGTKGHLHINGNGIHLSIGKHGPRFKNHRFHRGHRFHRPVRHFRHQCTGWKAVRKASRYGVHRARVVYAGRNSIVVRGYKWRSPVKVVMGRHASCPVRYLGRR